MSAFWPLLVPALLGSLLWLWRPSAAVSRAVSLLGVVVLAAWIVRLFAATSGGHVLVHPLGGWQTPYGITLALDGLSVLFLALLITLLAVVLLALRPGAHGDETVRRAHPLLWWLTFGLSGAFTTGDLFNLFVMFELVLVASYLLLQVPGSARARAAALPTVVLNLVTSLLFLAGLGLLYGLCGSLNLADLTVRIGDADPLLRRAALGMLVVAFAAKAAVVPLCFWMPATYPTLSAPLAALFAGIMGKLGVYALIRILPLLQSDPLLLDGLVVAGALSALLGVLAALSQYEVRRLLAFHSVSQVGYIVLGIGLATPAGVAAAIFFTIHHSLVKSTLYLVADELERRNASRDLRAMAFRRSGGASMAIIFGIAAFSLAGLPPFSGFFGKLALFRAAYLEQTWLALVALLVASVFTLASMLKIWQFAFATRPDDDQPISVASGFGGGTALLIAALLILGFGFAAGPAHERSEQAAFGVLEPTGYVESVLSAAARPASQAGGR
jgi:multicomponent Na+:H+ antiporter subunit D